MTVAPLETLHRCTAYGLTIDSTFPLPELTRRHAEDSEHGDVRVRAGVLEAIPGDALDLGEGARSHGATVWLSYEGACRLRIREGREIVVEGEPGIDERVLRLFVLGVALGVLLHQRGFLSLHGSAAEINGAAVAFLGFAGDGKSTMTAALRARGHAVVADDVVAVDLTDPARPMVYPGFPQLKLTPESAAALGHDLGTLNRIHATHPKYGFPVGAGLSRGRLPLASVYMLARDGDVMEIETLEPQDALVELIRHTYTAGLLEPGGTMGSHMRQCAALIGAARMRRLRRPFDLTALPMVAALVERDCAGT